MSYATCPRWKPRMVQYDDFDPWVILISHQRANYNSWIVVGAFGPPIWGEQTVYAQLIYTLRRPLQATDELLNTKIILAYFIISGHESCLVSQGTRTNVTIFMLNVANLPFWSRLKVGLSVWQHLDLSVCTKANLACHILHWTHILGWVDGLKYR